jgi:hypothetical protein
MILESKMERKVLGPGCPKCLQIEKIVKETLIKAGVDARVEEITDIIEIIIT